MEINWLTVESPGENLIGWDSVNHGKQDASIMSRTQVFQRFFQKLEEGRLDCSSPSHFSHFSYELAPHLHISKFKFV